MPLGTLGTSGRRRELAGLSGGANLFPPAKAADTEPPVTSVSPHVARRRKRSLSSSSEPSSRCGSGRPGAAAGTRAGADGSSSPGSPCACWVRPVPCLSPACPHVPRGPGPLLWGRHCSEEILSRLIRGAPWGGQPCLHEDAEPSQCPVPFPGHLLGMRPERWFLVGTRAALGLRTEKEPARCRLRGLPRS